MVYRTIAITISTSQDRAVPWPATAEHIHTREDERFWTSNIYGTIAHEILERLD
jgi:hypothetical protein